MHVQTTHHVDASEPDAQGQHDYFYEYDLHVFSDGDDALVARCYVDTPEQASFLSRSHRGRSRPLTDADLGSALMREAIGHLRAQGKTRIQWLSGRGHGYDPVPLDAHHPRMIHNARLTARLEGDFVVFLIGMRINRPLHVHKWWPVAQAMPRMLRELYRQPELGFLHAEMWFARTTIMVQYWRSMDQLLAYAKDRNAAHLPAWQAFNRAVGTDGSVGIWHETYAAGPGSHENVYVNMPPFGLGRAGTLEPAAGGRQSAEGRLGRPPAAT